MQRLACTEKTEKGAANVHGKFFHLLPSSYILSGSNNCETYADLQLPIPPFRLNLVIL